LRRAPIPGISSSGEPRIAIVRRARCRADREPVRLVAQPLQEVKHRSRGSSEKDGAGHEKPLAPSIAVGALGDRGERDIADPISAKTACAALS